MAILAKCSKCGRKGGYAEDASDEVCARCKGKEKKRDSKGQFQKE